MVLKSKEPNNQEWSRFVKDGLVNWSESNFSNVKYDFPKMTKLFGLSYIYWLECQYRMIDTGGFNREEMLKWNGNVPESFLKRFV